MSHIPNSAIPHAAAGEPVPTEAERRSFLLDGASRLADKAREMPKSTVAIGAAVVAGAVAAAAIPLARRSRRGASGKKGSNKSSKD